MYKSDSQALAYQLRQNAIAEVRRAQFSAALAMDPMWWLRFYIVWNDMCGQLMAATLGAFAESTGAQPCERD